MCCWLMLKVIQRLFNTSHTFQFRVISVCLQIQCYQILWREQLPPPPTMTQSFSTKQHRPEDVYSKIQKKILHSSFKCKEWLTSWLYDGKPKLLNFPFGFIMCITALESRKKNILEDNRNTTQTYSNRQLHNVSSCNNFIQQIWHDMTNDPFARQVTGMHANSTCTVYAWAETRVATWMPLNTHIWCCMLIC